MPSGSVLPVSADPARLPDSLARMRHLVSPFGLVSSLTRLPVTEGEPDFCIYTGSLGDPSRALSVHADWQHDPSSGNFDGAGGALDPELAAHLAVAESLERYSSCAWDPDALVWATAAELGEDAVGPDQWPQCSARELADPRCGLVPSDPRLPIRWVQGWSLTRGRPVFVPAICVYLQFPAESGAERFTHPVSTGCAAHGDLESAVVNGLLEVIERDSIALTWLQRLRLPRLDIATAELPAAAQEFVRRAESENIRTLLFDATTDLGVPVVYGLQLADHDPALAQMVIATCDTDTGRAVAKLHREGASLRIALRALAGREDAPPPQPAEDTLNVIGGALLAGPPQRRDRFEFLLDGERPTHRLADLPRPGAGEGPLPWLLERVHRRGGEVVVVDLTTDEARQAGARVVRVLVPQLMPLSFAFRARYLAHPRLYDAPAAMGLTVHGEPDLNPHPQPFA